MTLYIRNEGELMRLGCHQMLLGIYEMVETVKVITISTFLYVTKMLRGKVSLRGATRGQLIK